MKAIAIVATTVYEGDANSGIVAIVRTREEAMTHIRAYFSETLADTLEALNIPEDEVMDQVEVGGNGDLFVADYSDIIYKAHLEEVEVPEVTWAELGVV